MIHLRDQDVIAAICFWIIVTFTIAVISFSTGWCLGRRYWKKLWDENTEGYR